MSFRCPKCRGETRAHHPDANYEAGGTLRHRDCLKCKYKFKTLELQLGAVNQEDLCGCCL
jgi:transcriptional regulator NrdR family protein